jgi:hypothetical protein
MPLMINWNQNMPVNLVLQSLQSGTLVLHPGLNAKSIKQLTISPANPISRKESQNILWPGLAKS